MPFAERRLTSPTTLSTVASTVYTVPAQYTTIVKQVVVTNTTASPASFNLYIGSATAANAIFSNTTVSANDSLVINLSQVLSSLEILTASANANSAINMTISGVDNNGPLDPATVYIADGAITTSRLANASVTTDKLAANAVATVNIASNAVTQAKLSTDVPLSGIRNAIINGSFDIWQRGTSGVAIAATASSSFRADRWTTYRSVAGSTQSQISPSLDGFQYALRIQRDSGNTATNTIYAGTSLETSTATKLVNKPVVLSFYARAGSNYSAASSGLAVLLSSGTGAETNGVYNAFTSATSVISTTATLTTSWQRFIYYGTMPATSTQLLVQFGFTPVGTASTNDYFDITGVQLEQNVQPTPFEQRPIGVELALCQRYFVRFANSGQFYGVGQITPTNAAYVVIPLPVPMRTAPNAISVTGTFVGLDSGGVGRGFSSVAYSSGTENQIGVYCSGGFNFTNGNAMLFFSSGSTSISVNGAEL